MPKLIISLAQLYFAVKPLPFCSLNEDTDIFVGILETHTCLLHCNQYFLKLSMLKNGALATALAIWCASTATAFINTAPASQHQRPTVTAAFGLTQQHNSLLSTKICVPLRSSTSRKLAADDDDDEDDDDDDDGYDDPLSKGVDSVSWLPSVTLGKVDSGSGGEVGLFIAWKISFVSPY